MSKKRPNKRHREKPPGEGAKSTSGPHPGSKSKKYSSAKKYQPRDRPVKEGSSSDSKPRKSFKPGRREEYRASQNRDDSRPTQRPNQGPGSNRNSKEHRNKGSNQDGPKPPSRDRFTAEDDGESHRLPPDLLKKAREETKEKLATWLQEGTEMRAASGIAGKKQVAPYDELDPWQRQAFDALLRGDSVVVDAPTTAGKTRVVEAYFAMNIDKPGFRAAYTTPVKSLSNDKLRELRAMFGSDRVGIATGDIKENLDAPIVVATLESYRN